MSVACESSYHKHGVGEGSIYGSLLAQMDFPLCFMPVFGGMKHNGKSVWARKLQ